MKRKDLQMTYKRDEAGIRRALADLAAATSSDDDGDALASLDERTDVPTTEQAVGKEVPDVPRDEEVAQHVRDRPGRE